MKKECDWGRGAFGVVERGRGRDAGAAQARHDAASLAHATRRGRWHGCHYAWAAFSSHTPPTMPAAQAGGASHPACRKSSTATLAHVGCAGSRRTLCRATHAQYRLFSMTGGMGLISVPSSCSILYLR